MTKDGGDTNPGTHLGRGLLGAALGAAAGHFLFGWLLGYGFYAPAIPGVLAGLGAGFLARGRSVPLAAACAVIALAAGIFTRWSHNSPPVSLGHFLAHLHQLTPVTLIMLALGGLAGFWFALGPGGRTVRNAGPDQPTPPP